MLAQQCISVTDLKKNANAYVDTLEHPRFVFVNNKPKAVLMDISMYEKMKEEYVDFVFDPPVSPKEILDAHKKAYGRKAY